MAENIGLVWLKDDFRLKKNLALIEATKENNKVVVFFLLKKKKFDSKKPFSWRKTMVGNWDVINTAV